VITAAQQLDNQAPASPLWIPADPKTKAPLKMQLKMQTTDVPSSLGYAGDKTPKETWEILASKDDACLIDVRSQAEWSFVGICDLSSLSKQACLIPLLTFPGMQSNDRFVSDLKAHLVEQGIGEDAPLLFVCRSGQRSIAAAKLMTEAGFSQCLNVLEGFEGDLNGEQHRARISGWKVSGLPWKQQ
jgi:rhodanese-related sulfurtransferase